MSSIQPSVGRGQKPSIPRLISSTEDGKPYERRPDVEINIGAAMSLPRADWIRMAPDCQAEVLVFLIRQLDSTETPLFGILVNELLARIINTARKWSKGFDTTNTEEILIRVEREIIELLLADPPTRRSEYLEIAFTDAVKKRTLNAVSKCKTSPLYRAKDVNDTSEALEPVDQNPVPENVLLALESRARRPELIRKAYAAVKDQRHLEAVILRYVHNWTITDNDPDTPTLAKLYGKSGRQIQNWISAALKAMRAALGENV
jgi:hypothetical protein